MHPDDQLLNTSVCRTLREGDCLTLALRQANDLRSCRLVDGASPATFQALFWSQCCTLSHTVTAIGQTGSKVLNVIHLHEQHSSASPFRPCSQKSLYTEPRNTSQAVKHTSMNHTVFACR